MLTTKRLISSRMRIVAILIAWLCPASRAWWVPSSTTTTATTNSRSTAECETRCNLSRRDYDNNPTLLESLLKDHGFDQRLIRLTPDSLPCLAEFQQGGQAQVGWIQGLLLETTKKTPKLSMELPDGSFQTVDIGQITTIWQDDTQATTSPQLISQPEFLSNLIDNDSVEEPNWPVGHVESALDQLWKRRGLVSGGTGSLTKKQIANVVAAAPESCQQGVDQVLRQVIKAGKGYSRLVDSEDVQWALFQNQPKASKKEMILLQRRAYSANLLAEDSRQGGRFKRFGCIPVPTMEQESTNDDDGIHVINGGWLALDQSVRASSEARKFSERATSNENGSSVNTMADERIIHRLECFAMERGGTSTIDEMSLALDVRETLKAMQLPTTPEGAKQALIQMGRWSQSQSEQAVVAWSKPILTAAEWYSNMDSHRRRQLFTAIRDGRNAKLEGRVDLTSFPSICVDAARASFRDDAMSVRPRASTGRKMNPKASKWEILLHISDVSDIYATRHNIDDPNGHLEILHKAAAGRGVSRYDMPSGPLHLLPPIALQSLGFKTINPDLTSKSNLQNDMKSDNVNRCVTLWVYIDERNGKILDAGLERTIISCPLALSFHSATELLEGSLEKTDPGLKQAKAVLGIVERNVGLWKEYHTARNEASQAREKRLAARELVGRHAHGGDKRRRDDGQEGFVRTRGHQTVDSCLELYGFAINRFLTRKKAALPRVAGTGPNRLGRVATAPLRRFVDGIAQRQALAVICGYGGDPLSKQECIEIGKATTKVINKINNLGTRKAGLKREKKAPNQKRNAIQALKIHLSRGKSLVPAMGTGHQNEVVILGVGAVASCKGVHGTLKPGQKVMVKIEKVDEDRGKVSAVLARS